jgi:hypothetical protein
LVRAEGPVFVRVATVPAVARALAGPRCESRRPAEPATRTGQPNRPAEPASHSADDSKGV